MNIPECNSNNTGSLPLSGILPVKILLSSVY